MYNASVIRADTSPCSDQTPKPITHKKKRHIGAEDRGDKSLPFIWAELMLSLDWGWPVGSMGTIDSQSVDGADGICDAGSN